MTDEARLAREADRGARAKALLENELLNEALDKIEDEVVKAWKESGADDEKVRANAYVMHRLLKNLRGELTRTVSTGEVAAKHLLEIRDPSRFSRMING